MGLETGNSCRNTVLFQQDDRPWCYARGEKMMCDIPKCESKCDIPKCESKCDIP